MSLTELVWFDAVGYVYDVEQPNPSGTSNQPALLDVSGYVNFYPGTQENAFASGFTAEVQNLDHGDGTSGPTLVPLAPITARLMSGALCAIAVGDPIGQQLLAGAAILNLANPLYYHVKWQNITYGGALQSLSNFAFAAPTGNDSPTSLSGTSSSSGGAFVAGEYYWGVTALTTWGETALSNVITETLSGGTSSVALSWLPSSEAIGYNVYRGLAANALNTLVASGATCSYVDVGSAGTSVTAPLLDTLDITSSTLVTTEYGGP